MPMFKDLQADEQDSVRLLAVKNLVAFAELANEEEEKKEILKIALDLARDRSWRVRWSVADNIVGLIKAVGAESCTEELVPAYLELLKDEEAEVRTAAVFKVTEVAALLKDYPDIVKEKFLPEIQVLATDS